MLQRCRNVLLQPVHDARPLCAFRALFGTCMLVHVCRLHFLSMYRRSVLEPTFHFQYELAPVIPPTSEAVAQVHLGALAVCSLGIALGLCCRTCCVAFALLYTYFVLCERTMFNNHYYLYILIATQLAIADTCHLLAVGGAFSGRAQKPQVWQVWLLRLQLCIVYFYAGVAKCNADWLLHHEPMRTKLRDEAAVYTPSLRWLLASPSFAQGVSIGGVVFDLAIGPMLLHPRSRGLAALLATGFHMSNSMLWSLGEFPWVMAITSLLFFDHVPLSNALLARAGGRCEERGGGGSEVASGKTHGGSNDVDNRGDRGVVKYDTTASHPSARWMALGVIFGILQLLLPLRPALASGFDMIDAVHTKTHTLLSWRMMAVSTRNFINISLRSEALGGSFQMMRTYNRLAVRLPNGSRHHLQLSDWLLPRQAGYMPYTPHMLLQFAQAAVYQLRVCRTAAARCRVEGDLWSSINDRPLQRFVSPQADLSAVRVPLLQRPEWVMPLLRVYGNSVWRARVRWLRRRLQQVNHSVAFFADTAGGSFDETFPRIDPFPAQALLLPLDGHVILETRDAHTGQPRSVAAIPPRWELDAFGQPRLLAQQAPLPVPFGAPHAVRTQGAGPACWAYVFGVVGEGSSIL